MSTSETIDDGGAAFPKLSGTSGTGSGMSLLDYFAGQAMQGMMAHPHITQGISDTAYKMAVEMLNVRGAIHANRGAK